MSTRDLGSVTSYAMAVALGFEGTEAEWVTYMMEAGDNAASAAASAASASASATSAETSAETARINYGSPLAASTLSGMTEQNRVYVYTGEEQGMTYGDWYYYDGTGWVDGGIYNTTAEGGGITSQEKSLILTLFSKAAYAEDDAGEVYDALAELWAGYSVEWVGSGFTHGNTSTMVEGGKTFTSTVTAATGFEITTVTATMGGVTVQGAWNNGTVTIPNVTGNIVITVTTVQATVSSINAVYVQSGAVSDTDSLDSLKSDLVVTATYVDSTTYAVPAEEYTLSGTLAIGTSTITVTYMGQTDTFTVTVTPEVIDYTIDPLDGITWHDGYTYNKTTGIITATTGEHCTDKFDGQNCIYILSNTNTTNNKYVAVFAWDGSGTYLGCIESAGKVFSLKKGYKYAIKVYNTGTFDPSTLSFLPKDNSSTASSQFSIKLSDYIGNISINGDRLEFNVSTVMNAAGITSANANVKFNKCNYLAVLDPISTTDPFALRSFRFWFYNVSTFMFRINGVSSVAEAETWITENEPEIIFNS